MNENGTVLLGGMTDKGPVREANEDAFALPVAGDPTQLGMLVIVADGVGGQEHGALASSTAVATLRPTFYDARRAGQSVPDALREAVQAANRAVYDLAQEKGAQRMGCTLVAAVQDQDQLYAAHIGDARLYLLRGTRLNQLTRDDTWVQQQVDAGIITPEQAAKHELRNVVTRVMGNEPELEANYLGPETLRSGDRLLLCSDGLYDVLTSEKMASILSRFTPQNATEELVQAAVNAGASDNVTAVVLKVGALAEATLSGVAPLVSADAPEEQPTEMMPAVVPASPPSPPPPQKKSRGSAWLVILLLVVGLLAVAAAAVLLVFPLTRSDSGPVATAVVPTIASTAGIPATSTPVPAPTAQPTTTLAPEPTAVPPTDAPPTTEASPEAAVAPTAEPCLATVTESVGAILREGPGTNTAQLGLLNVDTQIELLLDEAPVNDGQFTWRRVRSAEGQEGWVADFTLALPACAP